MEERRKDYMDLTEMKSDLKLLLTNQAEIKKQVERTNGRVTLLEKFMYTLCGGATIFVVFELNKLIQAINQ
jgi:hypothetical protein